MKDLLRWFRAKAYECPACGWQGMSDPQPGEVPCPECGEPMKRRSWLETWGLTLLILAIVAATVRIVLYFAQRSG